jgi:cell division protease FtsH
MNVVNVAATMAVETRAESITHAIIFEAIEKVLFEGERRSSLGIDTHEESHISPILNRKVALRTAAKALLAYITPFYDDVNKLSCFPNSPNRRIFFIPREEHLETGVLTRSYLESRLTVLLATKAVQRLFQDTESDTNHDDPDITDSNLLAMNMVFKYGFGRRLGSLCLFEEEIDFLKTEGHVDPLISMNPIVSSIGLVDVADYLAAAEAKAYYGLITNYRCLEALSTTLEEKASICSEEFKQLLLNCGVKSFHSPLLVGLSSDPKLNRFETITLSLDYNHKEAYRRVKENLAPQNEKHNIVGRQLMSGKAFIQSKTDYERE